MKSDKKNNVNLVFHSDPSGDLLGLFLCNKAVFHQVPEKIYDAAIIHIHIHISFSHLEKLPSDPSVLISQAWEPPADSLLSNLSWLTRKGIEVPIASKIKNQGFCPDFN